MDDFLMLGHEQNFTQTIFREETERLIGGDGNELCNVAGASPVTIQQYLQTLHRQPAGFLEGSEPFSFVLRAEREIPAPSNGQVRRTHQTAPAQVTENLVRCLFTECTEGGPFPPDQGVN